MLLLHPQGGESSYLLALEEHWSQCFFWGGRESWIHPGSQAGKSFLQKAQAGGLGLGTRLVFQLQCSINADSCCHPRVRSRTGAGVAFVAQHLPSDFG